MISENSPIWSMANKKNQIDTSIQETDIFTLILF